MVTGVETAGLILAALPILIEALSVYKSGLDKTATVLGLKQKKYKLKVERLRRRLQTQRASLHINLSKLIGRAAPSEDGMKLPETYNDALWTGDVAEKVKAYLELGGAFQTFQDILSLYESYLEEIAGKLDGIFRPAKADTRDLKALLKLNKCENGRYHFSQRLSFVMSESSIDQLLKDLCDSTLTLREFVDDNEDLHQIQRSNQEPPGAKIKKVTSSLYAIRKHANALFRAITCGWNQNCHERHEVMLCLEHRCINNRYALRTTSKDGADGTVFILLFSSQYPSSSDSKLWHEASVVTIEEDGSGLLCPKGSMTSSAKKSVTMQATPTVVVTSTSTFTLEHSLPVEVTNICKALIEAQSPVFQLSRDNRLFCGAMKPTKTLRLIEQGQRTISLDAFLEDRRQIYPDDRIKLATNLAASLLQYNLTPWLLRCWTNKTVHLALQPRATSGVDVDHPLILKHFDSQSPSGRYEQPEDDPEFALMELGILLLEIWTMKTFESYLKEMGHTLETFQIHDKDTRLRYSIEWFRSVKVKLLPNYCRVVGICLRPSAFDLFRTSWEDPDFRFAFYKEIVDPLLNLDKA